MYEYTAPNNEISFAGHRQEEDCRSPWQQETLKKL